MSINKKLTIFVVIIVTVPMLILFFISTFVMNEQVWNSEQSYLENALKIARNEMLRREDEMKNASNMVTEQPHFKQALKQTDQEALSTYLENYKKTYAFLDMVVILDANKRPVVSFPGDMKHQNTWDINGLVDKAQIHRAALNSEEILLINDYFYPNSKEYRQFQVELVNGSDNNSNKYLEKCAAGVVVTPVYSDTLKHDLLGFIVVADLFNNDDYFPNYYSKSVKGSYLAISIDGIRITSNIQTPKKTNYVGSKIPLTMESLEGHNYYYFGRESIDNEIHVFLDEPLVDSNGTVIGVLGVGIPEDKFSAILSINHRLIIIVTISCLGIMLVLGRYFSRKITNPILEATRCAISLGSGEREFVFPEYLLKDEKSETTILLKSFQILALDLKHSEEECKVNLDKLQLMNGELETKVSARTQDLQQAIQALKKADHVKSQFLANMSHELRTPLSAIICCSEVLKDNLIGYLNEKQDKYVANILNSGTHLLQLINDILDISKVEAGKMKLNLATFYISEVVSQSFNIVKTLAYRKNIDVTIKIDPPDFKINADAKKLTQILYNLLSNAIKFTSDFGKVELEVYERGEFMLISVKDNGIGIKEEDQERVFREFEQVDSSYERHYEGTGLGLPLTHKLVQMHGGEIHLTSKIDVGTELIATIPINTEGGTYNGNSSGC